MDEIRAVWPQWRTVELLGNGSFGSVYKVEKEDFGKKYYAAVKTLTLPDDNAEIKTLKASGMDDQSIRSFYEERVNDLVNEIQIMERLKTAGNIVSIEDYKLIEHTDRMAWTLYIRMELLESLDTWLEKKGQLTPMETVELGIDICSALECCEMSKTIHRDIKPENIFRNPYGAYKLGDFGLSKQMELASSARSSKGTPLYVAPEVYHGESYDNRVDIYSLGIMLYRFLNRNRFPLLPPAPQPLRPNDISRALTERMEGALLPPPCDADETLAAIILKACAYAPENRYHKASELKEALVKWQMQEKYGNTAPSGAVSGFAATSASGSASGKGNAASPEALTPPSDPGIPDTDSYEKTQSAFRKHPKPASARAKQKPDKTVSKPSDVEILPEESSADTSPSEKAAETPSPAKQPIEVSSSEKKQNDPFSDLFEKKPAKEPSPKKEQEKNKPVKSKSPGKKPRILYTVLACFAVFLIAWFLIDKLMNKPADKSELTIKPTDNLTALDENSSLESLYNCLNQFDGIIGFENVNYYSAPLEDLEGYFEAIGLESGGIETTDDDQILHLYFSEFKEDGEEVVTVHDMGSTRVLRFEGSVSGGIFQDGSERLGAARVTILNSLLPAGNLWDSIYLGQDKDSLYQALGVADEVENASTDTGELASETADDGTKYSLDLIGGDSIEVSQDSDKKFYFRVGSGDLYGGDALTGLEIWYYAYN